MDQTDADGKPIGIMPAILQVPTSLSAMATMLFKSLEIRDTTASTKYQVANPHAGKFREGQAARLRILSLHRDGRLSLRWPTDL